MWVDDLCSECHQAEQHAMYAIAYDMLQRDSEVQGIPVPPERRANLSLLPHVVKAGDDPRGTRYGLAGLRNIILRLADRGDRNNGLFFAARCAGELVAGGQLDGNYTLDTLLEAAEALAPDERWKSKNTVTRGLRVGLENPRVPRRAA